MSADVSAQEGLNAHAILIDDLHAHKNRQLWDTLRYAGSARRQPLHLSITTAGNDKRSICWEQHAYASQVLDETIEDRSFFAFIATADDIDDWTTEATWRKANPSFGITMDATEFGEDCREARESPAKENTFRRYRLNQWTEQDVRWLSMEKWDACGAVPEELEGRTCYAGLDLSSTTDITAFVHVFSSDDSYDVLTWFWVPEDGARQREKKDRVPHRKWIKLGLIEATPGEVVDYDRIKNTIVELCEKYHIAEIAVDRWNATQITSQLSGEGFEIVAFFQGFTSMNSPTKKLERWFWRKSWRMAATLFCGGWQGMFPSRRTPRVARKPRFLRRQLSLRSRP